MTTLPATAGAAGAVPFTTKNTAGQLIVPASLPAVTWHPTSADRTNNVNATALTVTGSGSAYSASWTAGQAPAAPATRYLRFVIEVSAGVSDVDADDEISFVDAVASVSGGIDILTLAEAKTALNNTTIAGDDAWLALWVTAVSEVFDAICGPVVIHAGSVDLQAEGGSTLILPLTQIASIESVTSYSSGTPTAYTLDDPTAATPTDGYRARLAAGLLHALPGYRWASGTTVRVAYTAGRFTDTASVGAKWKAAASVTLAHFWRPEQGQGSEEFGPAPALGGLTFSGLPNAAQSLLSGEKLGPNVG